MPLQFLHSLVQDDFKAVNQLIINQLHSHVALINQLSHHIIHSGGKRLRPLLVLLSAKAFNYVGEQHITSASIIEFIHTATLLHDDVVDNSNLRRGKKTANAIWGNEASVLVGDFLYSRAFQMMVALKEKNLTVMRILADTTNTISEGEVMQLLNCRNPDVSEENYMQVIYSKTAKLFEAAAQIGAILANRNESEIHAAHDYGKYLGIAFQLVDDALDYCANTEEIGKNIGDDLAEGKPTLPLIHVLNHGNNYEKNLVRHAIEHGDVSSLDKILDAIESTQAISYTYRLAEIYANKAISALGLFPDSIYQEALKQLAEFSVARKF